MKTAGDLDQNDFSRWENTMNTAACSFNRLLNVWHQDAADESIDLLAAEFVSQVASAGGLVCVALVRTQAVRRFYGLACFLAGYGLTLRQRYRTGRDAVFVYAEIQRTKPQSEFAGAVVRAHVQAPQLEKVAA